MIDGDKLIGAMAVYLKNHDLLQGDGCVSTVMSNKALEDYLSDNGIKV